MSAKKINNYSYKHNEAAAKKRAGKNPRKDTAPVPVQNKLTLYALPLGLMLGLMLGFLIGTQENDMLGGMRAGLTVGITIGAFLFAVGKIYGTLKKK